MTTFASPGSATTGLQGYDLEGAKDKKKKSAMLEHGGTIVIGKKSPVMAAGFALVTDEGQVLLLRRSETGDHAGEWCFPGGKIEEGETAEQAAVRETLEEIGYTIDPVLERVLVCRITNTEVDFTTFFARVDEFTPTLDHEHTGFRWVSFEDLPDNLHPGVRSAMPLVISQATDTTMKVAKTIIASGEMRSLYIKRRIRNGEQIKQWAIANGFPTTLAPDDMHVTMAYSKKPVDWAQVPRSTLPILRVEGGERFLDRLGEDGEALVLRFASDVLEARHREIHEAGLVWKWPDFKPHITLTYQGAALALDQITPWGEALELGPEEWAEVSDNWMSTVVEKFDAGEHEMNNLSVFAQITKVDAIKRVVYGTAVVEEVDRAGEIFDYASSKPLFEKWSSDISKSTDGKSLGNVRSMHSSIAAGKLVDIGFDDTRKAIDIAAKVVDDNEWKKVEEGVYTGFSIGGKYEKRWADGANKRYTAAPSEISLVDLPCGPSATFNMIKVDGTEELRKFHAPATEDEVAKKITVTNADVAARAEEMAKASGNHFLDHIAEARIALEAEIAKAAQVTEGTEKTDAADAAAADVAKATDAAAVDKEVNKSADDTAGDTTADAVAKAAADKEAADKEAADLVEKAAADAKTTPDDVEQVWVSKRLPGQTFAKKGDLAKALLDVDAKAAAVADATPVLDALKAAVGDKSADKAVDKAVEKAVVIVTDKNTTIITKEEATALIKATDFATATRVEKRQVVLAARIAEVLDLLPEGVVVAKAAADTDELKKAASLYFVSNLLHMLACVESMEEEAEFTALFGGIAVPKELTDRFGAALVEMGSIVAGILDIVLSTMSEEERSEASKSVVMSDLFKRGARHAARDKAVIKTTHDAMVKMDTSCCPAAMKSEAVVDLEKVTAENDLFKAKEIATSELMKDVKAGIEMMAAERDALKITIEGLQKSVEELKEQAASSTSSMEQVQKHVLAFRYSPASTPAGTFRVAEKAAPVPDHNAITEDELRRRGDLAQANRLMPH